MVKYYKHQQEIIDKFKDKSIVPIFADAGTGKSATALGIIAHQMINHGISRVLIIAPNNVDRQWATEQVPRFLSLPFPVKILSRTLSYTLDNGNMKEVIRTRDILNISNVNIVITNIDQFSHSRCANKYYSFKPQIIVLDESTTIKNPKSNRTRALLYGFSDVNRRGATILSVKHKTAQRIILTGTPTTNSPVDIWAQMIFLDPLFWKYAHGFSGFSPHSFNTYYLITYNIIINNRQVSIPITKEIWDNTLSMTYGQASTIYGISLENYQYIQEHKVFSSPYKHIEELHKILHKCAAFVRIQDVVDMPEKVYISRTFPLTKEQKKLIKEFKEATDIEWAGLTVSATSAMVRRLRLFQISIGFVSGAPIPPPDLAPDDPRISTYIAMGNAETIVENNRITTLLQELETISGQVIIFTNYVAEASYIFDKLKDLYDVCMVTGWYTTPNAIEKFQQGEYKIMIANIKVLAKGFNLQNATYCIYYSNTTSAEDRVQSEARIWRIGQHHTCYYIDLVAEDSVDLEIKEAQKQRLSLLDYITSGE